MHTIGAKDDKDIQTWWLIDMIKDKIQVGVERSLLSDRIPTPFCKDCYSLLAADICLIYITQALQSMT